MDFAEEFCREHQIGIREVHRDFLAALRRYRWPGNLRELKNHVRRAVLFCEGDELTLRDLSDSITQSSYEPNGRAKDVARGWTLADRIACSERELLEQALKANGNNRTRTARALGISRVGLYKKLRRLGMIDAREEAAVAATTN
jgi:DNA-binding NtrC family response regulator